MFYHFWRKVDNAVLGRFNSLNNFHHLGLCLRGTASCGTIGERLSIQRGALFAGSACCTALCEAQERVIHAARAI